MDPIQLWKDRAKRIVEPTLLSDSAEQLAKILTDECLKSRGKKLNKRTQIRKFYDEVFRLNMEAKGPNCDWNDIHPLVNMMVAKAAYAKGRDLVSDTFLGFIRGAVKQIEDAKDLAVFTHFFEAFIGFYRMHNPSN